jgi:hypothetical protein
MPSVEVKVKGPKMPSMVCGVDVEVKSPKMPSMECEISWGGEMPSVECEVEVEVKSPKMPSMACEIDWGGEMPSMECEIDWGGEISEIVVKAPSIDVELQTQTKEVNEMEQERRAVAKAEALLQIAVDGGNEAEIGEAQIELKKLNRIAVKGSLQRKPASEDAWVKRVSGYTSDTCDHVVTVEIHPDKEEYPWPDDPDLIPRSGYTSDTCDHIVAFEVHPDKEEYPWPESPDPTPRRSRSGSGYTSDTCATLEVYPDEEEYPWPDEPSLSINISQSRDSTPRHRPGFPASGSITARARSSSINDRARSTPKVRAPIKAGINKHKQVKVNVPAARSKALDRKQPSEKDQFDKLYRMFPRAMLCAQKYGWSLSKCVSFGAKIRAEIATDSSLTFEEQAALALKMVSATLKEQMIRDKQKAWSIKKIMYIVTQQEDKDEMVQAVSSWSSQAEVMIDVKAPKHPVVECDVEIEVKRPSIECEVKAPSVDISKSSAISKAMVILEKQQNWSIRHIMYIVTTEESKDRMTQALSCWRSRVACAAADPEFLASLTAVIGENNIHAAILVPKIQQAQKSWDEQKDQCDMDMPILQLALVQQMFTSYDLDESGAIDSSEELLQLTTNLLTTTKAKFKVSCLLM